MAFDRVIKVSLDEFDRLTERYKWRCYEVREEEIRIDKEAADKKKQIEREIANERMRAVMSGADSFAYMAQLAKEYGNEQTILYKALFATSKAFSIAEATMNMYQAISEAGTLPFPANLGAMAVVGAQMATIVSSIMAVGMAHDGIDSVPATGSWGHGPIGTAAPALQQGETVRTAGP